MKSQYLLLLIKYYKVVTVINLIANRDTNSKWGYNPVIPYYGRHATEWTLPVNEQ